MATFSQLLLQALKPSQHNWFIWLATLSMVAGLFFLHWNPLFVVFAYFMETMVIGLIHVAKLWTTGKYGKRNAHGMAASFDGMNTLGTILFFLVHYFFFVFVQSVFVFAIFSITDAGRIFKEPFAVFKNYYLLLQAPEMQLTLGIVAVTQLLSAIRHFFVPQVYKTLAVSELFIQPYLRIFIQQFATIIAFGLFMAAGSGIGAALVLIVIRHVTDSLLLAAKHNDGARQKLAAWLQANNNREKHTMTNTDAEQAIEIFLQP